MKGLKPRKPQIYKKFLCNEENKQQLVELMHTCWSEMVIKERTVILVKEGDVFQISPEQEGQLTIPELKSYQEDSQLIRPGFQRLQMFQYQRF